MARNLGIVIPYRDRAEHLNKLLPHMAAFFSRATPDVGGNIFIQIVQQESGLEFNRGLIKNIGFWLCRKQCDYVCFHDVDYLPIWADYSEPDGASCIVWHGAETFSDPRGLRLGHNLEIFFGAVVLFKKSSFEQVNGYANSYWGWGYEDSDLLRRCAFHNVPISRRKGTFQALPHVNEGYDAAGKPSDEHIRNKLILEKKLPDDANAFAASMKDDGLSTIAGKFKITSRDIHSGLPADERGIKIEMTTVSLKR